jgi:type I restriction enzyme, S subunit
MEVKPGYQQTEVGVIPEDWRVMPIGQIATVGRGRVISHKEIARSRNPSYPVYSSQTSKNGVMGYLDTFEFEGEYITWTTDGANAGTVFARNGRFNCTNVCGTIKLKSDNHLFVSEVLGRIAPRHVSRHLGNPKLMNDVMKRVNVPLPPTKAEQEAIAEGLSAADCLIESLEGLLAKKRQLREGAAQALLTGKTRLLGFSGEWNVTLLGDVASLQKGTGLSRAKLSASGARPCILYGELFTMYGRVITRVASRTEADDGLPSVSGDVLIPGSTTTTGIDLATASALLVDDVALGGDINVVRRKSDEYDPAFLARYLTHSTRNAIAEVAQGTTIHHLYGRDLRRVALRLPPLPEQKAIAAILSDMDEETARLEAKLAKTREVRLGMTQELLTGRIRLV